MTILNHKIKLLGILGLLALIPFAYSSFYPGANTPVVFSNVSDTNAVPTTWNANLVGYADATICGEGDGGVNLGGSSNVIFKGPNDTNFMSFNDTCVSPTKLMEVGCSKNIKVNGVLHPNYALGGIIDCNANGYTACLQSGSFGRCV